MNKDLQAIQAEVQSLLETPLERPKPPSTPEFLTLFTKHQSTDGSEVIQGPTLEQCLEKFPDYVADLENYRQAREKRERQYAKLRQQERELAEKQSLERGFQDALLAELVLCLVRHGVTGEECLQECCDKAEIERHERVSLGQFTAEELRSLLHAHCGEEVFEQVQARLPSKESYEAFHEAFPKLTSQKRKDVKSRHKGKGTQEFIEALLLEDFESDE